MKDVDLKDLLVAFAKSFEDSCKELDKRKSKVNIEEVEFTFDVKANFDESLIKLDRRKTIRGVFFRKLSPGDKKLPEEKEENPKNCFSNLQIKLVLSNNLLI